MYCPSQNVIKIIIPKYAKKSFWHYFHQLIFSPVKHWTQLGKI